jgi:hypothetical protein
MPFVKARDHGLLDFDWDPAVTIPLVQTRAHGHAIEFLPRFLDRSTQSSATKAPQPDATTDILSAELRNVIAELRNVIADLRQDRDHWREQAKQMALPAPKPMSWWRWLGAPSA